MKIIIQDLNKNLTNVEQEKKKEINLFAKIRELSRLEFIP